MRRICRNLLTVVARRPFGGCARQGRPKSKRDRNEGLYRHYGVHGAATICQALDSVAGQMHPYFDHIVIDGV